MDILELLHPETCNLADADMMPQGRGLYGSQGHCWQLARFIKRTLIHRYTQNRKALGFVVLEKIFHVFPFESYGS